MDLFAKWASSSLIDRQAIAEEGVPHDYSLGMDILMPWKDEPEKWKSLYKLLFRNQQMFNPRSKQKGLNADLWDGRHYEDVIEYVQSLIDDCCDDSLKIDGSNSMAADLEVAPSADQDDTTIHAGNPDVGIAIHAGGVALVTDGVARLFIDEDGKVTITERLDPKSLELTPVAANPAAGDTLEDSALWVDSTDNDRLKFGAMYVGDAVAPVGDLLQTHIGIATNDDPTHEVRHYRATSTTNTPNDVTIIGSPASGKTWGIRAIVNVRETNTGADSGTFFIEGSIQDNGGTTTISGQNTNGYLDATIATATAVLAIDLSGNVVIRLTGANIIGSTYVWHVRTEVFGPTGT